MITFENDALCKYDLMLYMPDYNDEVHHHFINLLHNAHLSQMDDIE
jgi:hypothetical protein